MQIDYTNPFQAPNWRDVGWLINSLMAERGHRAPRLYEKQLYRCGTIKSIDDLEVIGSPATIFNLMRGEDQTDLDAVFQHYPIDDSLEVYHTEDEGIRRWLCRILRALGEGVEFPLCLHCHSGVDRTGVAVAAILATLDVPRDVIVTEYLWSEGKPQESLVRSALDGIGIPEQYFGEVDLDSLRLRLLM